MTRLGIVGAGSIVPFHMTAARMHGFIPSVICGKENSSRAQMLSVANHDLHFVSDLDALLETNLDAILIAVPVDSLVSVLEQCGSKGVPILVEKPVCKNLKEFGRLKARYSHMTRVAYNRRFYSSVASFKEEFCNKTGFVQVVISELSTGATSSGEERKQVVLENSVHILDLMQYLFGEINLTSYHSKNLQNDQCALNFDFESQLGQQGTLTILFNSPENTCIRYWSKKLSLELRPIEILRVARGMVAIPASTKVPIKTYKKKYEDWQLSVEDHVAKPGFSRQYAAFRSFIENRHDGEGEVLATLSDAEKTMKLAHQIAKLIK